MGEAGSAGGTDDEVSCDDGDLTMPVLTSLCAAVIRDDDVDDDI